MKHNSFQASALAVLAVCLMSSFSVAVADDNTPSVSPQQPAAKKEVDGNEGWKPLFNGKNLDGWKVTDFGGQGEVKLRKGSIVIEQGVDLSGITTTRTDIPRVNYEIEFEAQRFSGSDFFIGLTFPYHKDYCSLICGGWGGGIFGLSSIGGMDASENETTGYTNFTNGQWYKTRLKVTANKIEAWLDKSQIVDLEVGDQQVGVRFEMELSQPLGFATYQSTAHIRNARIRTLPVAKAAPEAAAPSK